MNKNSQRIMVFIVLSVITLGTIILNYFTPIFGDDLAFWNGLGLSDYHGPNSNTLQYIFDHIIGINGRLFDYMGPIIIFALPRFLQAIVMGGMAGLYFYAMLLSLNTTKAKHTAFCITFLAVVLASLPWWDLIMRVCHFNYLWGTTFCLLFFYFFFHGKKTYGLPALIGISVISFFAGATHEQTAVAMGGAIFCYSIWGLKYKSFTKKQWVILISLALGALLTITTPGIWHRAETGLSLLPSIKMIISTLPVYLILMLVVCVSAFRGQFHKLFNAESCTMLLAATIAAVIAGASGIAGRTGWFSESIALILLARICLQQNISIKKLPATILSLVAIMFIFAHFIVSILYQIKMYDEHEEMIVQFKESSDGIVYMDYIGKKEVPIITLFRVRGVYSPNDTWNPGVASLVYANNAKQLIILPPSFESKVETITDSLTIDSITVYRVDVPNAVALSDTTMIQDWNGMTRYVCQGPDFKVAFPLEKSPMELRKNL